MAAKGTFVLSTLQLRAAYHATRITYNIAKPVTEATLKTSVFIAKPTLSTTTKVLDSTRGAVRTVTGSVNKALEKTELALFTDVPAAEKSCKKIFILLDTDGDHFVSASELGRIGELSEVALTEDELAKAMHELDVDGDQNVSWDEFFDWWTSESDIATQLRRESRFAENQTKAKQMREKRAELSLQAEGLAMEQDEAWLSAKDAGELELSMTLRYADKDGEVCTGKYAGVDKKGAAIVSTGNGGKTNKLPKKYTVLANGYVSAFAVDFANNAMRELAGSDSDYSASDLEVSTDAQQGGDLSLEGGDIEAMDGKKKQKKLSKKDRQAAELAEAEAAAEAEAVAAEAAAPTDVVNGKMTIDDLKKLGSFFGCNLTFTELERAMEEMALLDKGDAKDGVSFKSFSTWFDNEPIWVEFKNWKPEDLGPSGEERPPYAIVTKIKAAKANREKLEKMGKKGRKILGEIPTEDEIVRALFQRLDTNSLGELNHDEFMHLPEIAACEMTPEELGVCWKLIDPDDKDEATLESFANWFNSNTALSDRVKADDNGVLLELASEYMTKRRKLKRGKSLDAESIRVVYKEDVEANAREKATAMSVLQKDAWRDGPTVLSEMDPEDLINCTVDIDGVGKGQVTGFKKGKYTIVIEGQQQPLVVKLPSKKVEFTVLSEQYIKAFIENSVNRAIANWAAKESKIRKKFEHDTKEAALTQKKAWTDGSKMTLAAGGDPDDLVDLRCDIKGYGLGTIVDYVKEAETKSDSDLHTIEFDSGAVEEMRLDKTISIRVMDQKFVNDYVKQEMRHWAQSRVKQTYDESETEAENAKKKKKPSRRLQRKLSKQKSRDSADEQAKLEEQLAVLKELFDYFDADKNGILDKDEFDELSNELGFRGNATQLDEAWTEVDVNKNGAISFDELRDFFLNDLVATISANMLRNQLVARIATYKDDMLLLRQLFVKYDADKNGQIDFEEYEVLAEALHFKGNATDLQDTFNEIDLDGNGAIDFPEFKRFFTRNAIDLGDSSGHLKELLLGQLATDRISADVLRRIFARHDDDGNGYMDHFEFDIFVEDMGFTGTPEDLEDMFKGMDMNNDGMIDWDEFVAYFAQDSMLGGEAAAEVRRNLFSKFEDQSMDLKKLRKMYDSVDTNNNGVLEMREFKKLAFKKLGFKGTEEEVEESFKNCDVDNSGNIDWNEFRDWYKSKNPDAVVRAVKDEADRDKDDFTGLKAIFQKVDKDHDGEIDRKEFKIFAKKIKLSVSARQLDEWFRQMDADKSGGIDFDELRNWYAESTDESVLRSKMAQTMGSDRKGLKQAKVLKTMFSRIDSDGSGEVDTTEMMQLVMDLGMEVEQQELDIIFQQMDLDGNGAIDFEEFHDWWKMKGGAGHELRVRLKSWFKAMSNDAGSSDEGGSVGFDKGKQLLGTKRVIGKVTYYFSRSSGPYSELKQAAEEHLTSREKTGFSTIDKLVFLQQTALFENMELGQVLRVAQVAEQLMLNADDLLFDEGEPGNAAYFIVNGEMNLHTAGIVVPMDNNKKPFGEISFLETQPRAGKMTASTECILLCIFNDDMKRLFKNKLVDENVFMHALGALVVNSLRGNYGRLEKASSEGTAGQDINLEIARAGWSYDASDFIYAKPAKSIREYGRTRKQNLETYVNKMVEQQALNAAVLSPESYSTVEKVILLKSCKIFDSASDAALSQVAELMNMIRLPANVQLYKEGEPGFDSFVIASGQVKLTREGGLIGLRGRGDINGATCLVMAGDKRSATVTTTTESLIMSITYEHFDEVMQGEPELRKGMMKILMDRLFDSYTRLNQVDYHRAHDRGQSVARPMLSLSTMAAASPHTATTVTTAFSDAEILSSCCCCRRSHNRSRSFRAE